MTIYFVFVNHSIAIFGHRFEGQQYKVSFKEKRDILYLTVFL